MFKEFKDFAMKGSLIDIAVGLVMGAAFATVTAAFIDGIFMPLIGMILNVGDLTQAKIMLSPAIMDGGGKVTTPESALLYGKFIGAVINFIVVAFVMFLVVKGVNKMKKEAAPAGPTASEALLAEIRDALRR